MAARKKSTRRKAPAAASRGLAPEAMGAPDDADLDDLGRRIEDAGGAVLARYRDPLGGAPLMLAGLPLPAITPTPFQRDLSDAHVKRLEGVIDRIGSFLDPVIAVPAPDDSGDAAAFWTPNGLHRLSALQRLGARSVTALVSPDPALAYRILALNTEKAHNTKERALEVVRMAAGLAELDPTRLESAFPLELEEPHLVTLGCAYEHRARFAGGAYAPVLKPSDAFLDEPLPDALEIRRERATRLLAIDDRVADIIAALKERGFESPYLRNFVVSRIRPFRPRGKPAPDAEALLDHMAKAAAKFDPGKTRSDQVARTAGSSE